MPDEEINTEMLGCIEVQPSFLQPPASYKLRLTSSRDFRLKYMRTIYSCRACCSSIIHVEFLRKWHAVRQVIYAIVVVQPGWESVGVALDRSPFLRERIKTRTQHRVVATTEVLTCGSWCPTKKTSLTCVRFRVVVSRAVHSLW
jgi:hypothetical protein